MNTIAIDPGMSGGIAFFDTDGQPQCVAMPHTEGDLVQLLTSLRVTNHRAIVEDQTGCAGIRVSAPAMFKFGRSFGVILGTLQALGYRIELVRPQLWQKRLALGTSNGQRTEWKNKLKAEAQRLFPHLSVTLKTADALLLLEFARRTSYE